MMRDVYPISIIPRLKEVPELISICCSIANPIEVIIIETKQGKAFLGVVDGFKPKEIESSFLHEEHSIVYFWHYN